MISVRFLAPLALAAAACTASAGEVAPPRYQPYYPTGLVISPDERFLFVLSANSDLRYSSGSVMVVDLDRVDAIAAAWTQGRDPQEAMGCAPVVGRPHVLGCPTELASGAPSPVMVPGGSVAVGNFGVSIGVQQLLDGDQPSPILRLFATVRGDPSVTWMDFDTTALTMSCGGSGDFPRCAETHRLARLRNDASLFGLPEEPFNLHVSGDHVFATHFTSGFVSLFSAPRAVGSRPMLQDIQTSLWAGNNVTGQEGAAGVAARPNDPSGLVYVTSRQEARVAMLAVATGMPDEDQLPRETLVRAGWFFLSGIERPGLQGDQRDLRFSPDGNRMWVVNRLPPSLHQFDTTLDARGVPRNQLLGTLEVCAQPANLELADFGTGLIAAVPCFLNGQVWFVDAATLRILAIEESGRGPNGLAAAPGRRKLYVGNYAEDTLSVIDLAPGSPDRYHVVLRLGTLRPIEDQI